MAMSYRQIETSREVRQWIKLIGQGVVTAAGMTALYLSNPSFKTQIDGLSNQLKERFTKK